ncbi:hypothetical protein [Oceanobacillus sp. FSL H7-0719]
MLNKTVMDKRTRNWILILLFLGWCLGNADRYIMNYAASRRLAC